MRLDKFLWSVRTFKTRTIATEEIKKNRVSIGGIVAKASREVKPGDLISVRKNQIEYSLFVKALPKSRVGAKLVSEYIQDRTSPQQLELLRFRMESQGYYRNRGEGRPTKKDRRDLEFFSSTQDTDWDNFFMNEEEEED